MPSLRKIYSFFRDNDLQTFLTVVVRKSKTLAKKYYFIYSKKVQSSGQRIGLDFNAYFFHQLSEHKFSLVQIILFFLPRSRQVILWKGLLALRMKNAPLAKEIFNDYPSEGTVFPLGTKTDQNTGLRQVDSNNVRPEKTGAKICLYSILQGDLAKPLHPPEGVELICFAKKDVFIEGWKVVVVQDLERVKILPHEFLPDYDFSLYVSETFLLINHVDRFIGKYLIHEPFFMLRDFSQSSLADLSEALLASKVTFSSELIDLYAQKAAENTPILDDHFIWRSHQDASVRSLMESWWSSYSRTPIRSQKFVLNQLKPAAAVASPELSNQIRNVYFSELEAPSHVQAVAHKKLSKVVFLYDQINIQKGSSVLRCHQMAEIVARKGSRLAVELTSDYSTISNSIIIINKYFSTFMTSEALRALKEKGNILIADPVDDEIFVEKFIFFDGLMASSIKQYMHFKHHFPKAHIGYVLHHADTRLPSLPVFENVYKVAYFGEPANAFNFPGLENHVEIVKTDTSKQNLDWLTRMSDFNFHYAVRSKSHSYNVFKPFTKGIIAAHLGINIMVHQEDGDAQYYLSEDYPYLLKGELTPELVIEKLKFAKESFGGPEWKYGLEIMADVRRKTSYEQLHREFWDFLSFYL